MVSGKVELAGRSFSPSYQDCSFPSIFSRYTGLLVTIQRLGLPNTFVRQTHAPTSKLTNPLCKRYVVGTGLSTAYNLPVRSASRLWWFFKRTFFPHGTLTGQELYPSRAQKRPLFKEIILYCKEGLPVRSRSTGVYTCCFRWAY